MNEVDFTSIGTVRLLFLHIEQERVRGTNDYVHKQRDQEWRRDKE